MGCELKRQLRAPGAGWEMSIVAGEIYRSRRDSRVRVKRWKL